MTTLPRLKSHGSVLSPTLMANAQVDDTASWSGANRKLPALTMPTASSSHVRRQSMMSSGSSDSDEAYSPALSALDSSAALILVDDPDVEPASPLDFADDDDDGDEEPDVVSPMFEVRKSVVYPPLPPSLVFLFLLAPFLRLGALELPNVQLPLKHGLPALLLSALAAGFARQIWYMLARYLRKADMTDVLLHTFAKGRSKELQRTFLRNIVRAGSGTISMFIAVTYLRYSVYTLYPVLSWKKHPLIPYLVTTSLSGILVAYLSYARSLNSRRITYATWLSLATYTLWMGCTIYAHSHNLLEENPGWLGPPSVRRALITITFAFCSSSTLPLYASLKVASNPVSTGKAPRSRSFRVLSFLSIAAAVLLLLPSVIITAFPNPGAVYLQPSQKLPIVDNGTSSSTALNAPTPTLLNTTNLMINSVPSLSLPLPSEVAIPMIEIQVLRRIFIALTLILGIPFVIITTPPLAIPIRSVKFNVSRVFTIFIVITLSMIPPHIFPNPTSEDALTEDFYLNSSGFFTVLTILMLLMTFIGTYFLPALAHVLIHIFKRPLAIVVPPRTPLLHTPTTSQDADDPLSRHSSPRAIYDELLQRKERALQKKQFKKRIIWDIGVWLLLGASGTGVVLIAGTFLKFW